MSEDNAFWKTISTQSEVIRLKSDIEQLRSVSQAARDTWIQEKISLRKEIEQLQQEVRNEQEKVLSAKREIKVKEDKFDACNEQLNFARSEFFAEKEIYEKKILDYQKQINKLKTSETEFIGKIDGLRREHRNDLIDRDNLIRNFQCDIDMLVKEKEVLAKQLETVYSNLKDVKEIQANLQAALDEKQLLEEKVNKLKDSKRLSDIFHDELRELSSFRTQNEELREQNEALKNSLLSMHVLQTKVDVMEIEIQNLKRENENVAVLQRELDILRNEVRDWQSVTGVENPSAVCDQIAKLNETEKNLVKEVEKLQSKCSELQRVNDENNAKCLFVDKTSNGSNDVNKISSLEEQIKKLNETCTSLAKEKDECIKVIDACERLISISGDTANTERISELKSVISKYRSLASSSQTVECKDKSDEPSRKRLRSDEDSTNCKSSELQLQSLQRQLAEQTDLNKIISAENNTLKCRLQQMENSANSEVKASDNDFEKLKQQLLTTEKKQHHILEAFKKTSKEFREVVCMLTGYKIDVLKQKGYRLSHIYAEDPMDVLLFELEAGGTMKLLSTAYSERSSSLVETYVKKHDSFPAFLASLTMELFQKRTSV